MRRQRHFGRPRRPASDRILADLRAAEEAQYRMLPQDPPAIEGFSVAFRCVPARYVGGDLYEYIELPDGRWGIAVGDFSGHGLEAAIQMNFIKGHLLATAVAHADPAAVLREINSDFMAYRHSKKHFVAMIYGILDPRSQVFEFARAGGDIRLFWRRWKKRKRYIAERRGSFVMGFPIPEERFGHGLVTGNVRLAPGDALFLYTDGIPDARNPGGAHFGDQRLRQLIVGTDGLEADESLETVFSGVGRFLGEGRRPNDDMTLVVIRANEPGK